MLGYGEDNQMTVNGERVHTDTPIHFLYIYYPDIDDYHEWPDQDLTVEIPRSWQPIGAS